MIKLKKLAVLTLLFIAVPLLLYSCGGENNNSDSIEQPVNSSEKIDNIDNSEDIIVEYIKLTAEEAYNMMNELKDYILLDVRTDEEYREKHIIGSVLIPDYEIKTRAESELPDKNAAIFIYCRTGRRSADAAKILINLGYKKVYDFGGIYDWHYKELTVSMKKLASPPTVYSIKAPVAGNYPQSLHKYPNKQNTAQSSSFLQTIEWLPEIEKVFAKDTQYTAVLTLTPASDEYTFDGVSLDKVKNLPVENVSDISMDISGDSMIIKIKFEKTDSADSKIALLFYDDFDSEKLDGTKWALCPNWDRQGRSTWDEKLVSVSGGYLHLKFERDEELGAKKTSVKADAKNWIRAGAIRTMSRDNINLIFENAYGFYEAKIKFPKIKGMWGAFWLMSPTQHIITGDGVIGTEIDIVESIFSDKNRYNAALHWDGYGSNGKGVGSGDNIKLPVKIYDGEFHTFAIDWSPKEYIFYVDDIEFWRCDGGEKFKSCGINQNPNYIKLTVEGASWAGDLPKDFISDEMLVDYVKVYTQPKIK